jgi:hypothetical protein
MAAVGMVVAPSAAQASEFSGGDSHHAHPRGSAAATTFYKGYGTVCGGTPGGPCQSWWVDLHMQFTIDPSTQQTWDNGSSCTVGGTNLTHCRIYGNGTNQYLLEATYSTNGFFDFQVAWGPYGPGWIFSAPGWANPSPGWCVQPGNGCYGG